MAFINAEQEVEALGDDYVTGMLYQQITHIYREYYDHPKALEYIQKAILCYERAGKQQHKLFAQLVESAVYGGMGQRQKCIDRLCEIMEEAKQIEYIQLVRFCLGDLIIMNLDMERQEDAMKYYKELIKLLIRFCLACTKATLQQCKNILKIKPANSLCLPQHLLYC